LCPSVELRLPRPSGDLVEGMHPLGQVMKVLAVSIPLEAPIQWFAHRSLGKCLADTQAAARGMRFALLFAESADPTGSGIAGTVTAQLVMDLVHQANCELGVALVPCRSCQSQEVADSERVRPEVALLGSLGCEPGALGEVYHEVGGLLDG